MWAGDVDGASPGCQAQGPLLSRKVIEVLLCAQPSLSTQETQKDKKHSLCSQDLPEGLPGGCGQSLGPLLYRNGCPWAQIPPAPSEELPVPSLASSQWRHPPGEAPPDLPSKPCARPCFLEGDIPLTPEDASKNDSQLQLLRGEAQSRSR